MAEEKAPWDQKEETPPWGTEEEKFRPLGPAPGTEQAYEDFLNVGPIPTAGQMGRGVIKSIPPLAGAAGAILGGLSPVPGGAMIGAGLAATGGSYFKNMLEQYLLGDSKDGTDPHVEAFTEGLKNASLEAGGQILLNSLPKMLQKGGKGIYKRGTKAIDQKSIEMGKTPVSDDLIEANVWGGATSIEAQANKLADEFLLQRDAILKQGRKAGVEVSMDAAMAPARAKIAALKSNGDPVSLQIAAKFEKYVNALENMGAKESVNTLRELPVSGEFRSAQPGDVDYVPSTSGELPTKGKIIPSDYSPGKIIGSKNIPDNYVELPVQSTATNEGINYTGETSFKTPVTQKYTQNPPGASMVRETTPVYSPPTRIPEMFQPGKPLSITVESPLNESPRFYQKPPQIVLDTTERVPGVDVTRATKLKTAIRKIIPQSKFGAVAQTLPGQDLLKTMSGGLQAETEKALQKSLGLGDEFGGLNAKLGRLLTVKKKLSQEALKDTGGRILSGRDALWAVINPKLFALKKMVDVAGSAPKTGLGLGMFKAGKVAEQVATDPVWSRLMLEYGKDKFKGEE